MRDQIYLNLSFGIAALSAFLVVATKSSLPPVAPIFFGEPTGASQLGNTWLILLAPAVSTLVSIVNMLIAKKLSDEFLIRILIFSAFFVSILTLVTVIKIILLIGFF